MKPAQLPAHFDRISEAPDAVPRLRRFILDLAVRGKLVEQDPEDEPAAELLQRIQAQRKHLLSTGDIRKTETFEPIGPDEIPFGIPSGWEVARMGWLARKLGAGSTPLGGKTVYQAEGVPFLRSQNVHDDGLRLDDVALIPRAIHDRMAGTHIHRDDILLNITGASIGRCALVPDALPEGNVSQHVAIIRLILHDIREFIHLSLISPRFQQLIDDVQVGVSREGLSMQRLRLFPMLLPPLAEQRRIVAKVDELMALCDRLEAAQTERENRRDRLVAASLHRLNQPADPPDFREYAQFHLRHLPRLATRPEHVLQLRQTILNFAVRGKLVMQDANDEPATELHPRLVAETKSFAVKNGIACPKPEQVPEQTAPFRLPAGWLWVRLASLFKVVTDGDHLPPPKSDNGVAFLTIGNVTTGRLDFSGCRYVPQEYYDSIPPYRRPAKGDILYTVVGATYGRPALVETDRPFCVQRHIGILKPAGAVEVRYLRLLLASPFVYEQASRSVTGTAQPTIPLRPLRSFLVPLCPLAEQRRIVAKVEELMAVCDRLEAQLATAQSESRRLLEAVLHEALAPPS
jgi:type I restriction enzyme S subunit